MNARPLRVVGSFCLALSLFLALPRLAHGESLDDLDRIYQRAGGTRGFLRSSEAQNEYFLALQAYMGRYDRKAFDAIVEQLRTVVEKVPGFAERLDETNGLGKSFEIRSAVRTSGRTLDNNAWYKRLGEWRTQLVGQIEGGAPGTKDGERVALARKTLREAAEKIAAFDRARAEKVRGARNRADRMAFAAERVEFLQALAQTPEYRAAVAITVHRYLALEETGDVMNSGDADLILDRLREMAHEPKGIIRAVFGDTVVPETLASSLRQAVPEVDHVTDRAAYLAMRERVEGQNREKYPIHDDTAPAEAQRLRRLRNQDRAAAYLEFNKGRLFPIDYFVEEATGKVIEGGSGEPVTIKSTALNRRFHGIWDGAWLGECVSGNVSSLNSLTPERWAVVAIAGTQKHHLTRNGRFLGFTQQIPGKLGDKIFGSVEFGAPILKNKAAVVDTATNEKVPTTMFNLWLQQSSAHMPADWAGRVVGTDDAINNAGVLGVVRRSPSFLLNAPVGEGKDFKITDPLVDGIIEAVPRQGYAHTYGGRMITDATVQKQGALRPIAPITIKDIEETITRGEKDSLVIDMLTDPQWARHPKAAVWMKLLLDRGKVDNEIAEKLLTLRAWSELPEAPGWLQRIADGGRGDVGMVHVMKSPLWAEAAREHGDVWMQGMIERGKSHAAIAEHLLTTKHWFEHAKVRDYVLALASTAEGAQALVDKTFQGDWSNDRSRQWLERDFFPEVIDKLLAHPGAHGWVLDRVVGTPRYESNARMAAWVDRMSENESKEVHRQLFDKVLKHERWHDHPRALAWLWRMRLVYGRNYNEEGTITPEVLGKMRAAADEKTLGDVTDAIVAVITHHRVGQHVHEDAAIDELILLSAKSEEAAAGLGVLVADYKNRQHRRAWQRLIELSKSKGPTSDAAARYLLGYVGIFAPTTRSTRETLAQDFFALGRYAEHMEGEVPHMQTEIIDVAFEKDFYEGLMHAMDALAERAKTDVKLRMDFGAALSNLGRGFAQNTAAKEGATGASVGMLWLFDPFEDAGKTPVARRAFDLLVQLAVEEPLLVPLAKKAIRDAYAKGFTDRGAMDKHWQRLARNFPEIFEQGITFTQELERAGVRMKAAMGQEAAFEALMDAHGIESLLESETPGIRRNAAFSMMNALRAGGEDPFTAGRGWGEVMSAYRARHGTECAELIESFQTPPG